jgi:DNA polymerase V
MYALVDCNAFYANCERVFRPDLQYTPIVVLSNNDGCIIAQSREVKALGIPALSPYFKVKSQLKSLRVAVFSSNYELYSDLSMRMMTLLESLSKGIHIYSIDEAFLDLSGDRDLLKTGHIITYRIQRDIGLPVCVGIANTKTLTKLASYIAKQSKKCKGVCFIENKDDWLDVFKKISVNNIWGIGRKITKRLADLGVYSVYDFMQLDSRYIRQQFNVSLEQTHRELHHIPCFDFHDDTGPIKQIFRTRSFGRKVEALPCLQHAVSYHINNAYSKAKQHNLLVSVLLVFIQTSQYDEARYQPQAVHRFMTPTRDIRQLLVEANTLLSTIYKPNYRYAKAGVGFIELIAHHDVHPDLFISKNDTQNESLLALLDRCQKKRLPIGFGKSGILQRNWDIQRAYRSPRYTTQWDELPIIEM